MIGEASCTWLRRDSGTLRAQYMPMDDACTLRAAVAVTSRPRAASLRPRRRPMIHAFRCTDDRLRMRPLVPPCSSHCRHAIRDTGATSAPTHGQAVVFSIKYARGRTPSGAGPRRAFKNIYLICFVSAPVSYSIYTHPRPGPCRAAKNPGPRNLGAADRKRPRGHPRPHTTRARGQYASVAAFARDRLCSAATVSNTPRPLGIEPGVTRRPTLQCAHSAR